jgi:hypothetical protein
MGCHPPHTLNFEEFPMKITPAHFAVPVALVLQGLVSVAWAQEPSKQPPLEMPKSMAQLDLPKPDGVKSEAPKTAPEDKDKPRSVAIKNPKSDAPSEPAKDMVAPAAMGQYKVKAGDTIDRVIQKFYASTPLRSDVLRNALVQNNPQAFVKGNPKSLLAGATLMLPEPADVVKRLMPTLVADLQTAGASTAMTPVATAHAAPQGGAVAHQAGHNPGPDINKRNWVRYP